MYVLTQANEKYKGDARLQKCYTVDFLSKKRKANEGEVPQYYVEGSHDAIIEPAEWQLVQMETQRRKNTGRSHNCCSPFSAKLKCGDCGEYFGSKVWHFVKYMGSTPIINDYICDYGSCDWNLEEEIKKVQGSYGRLIFSLGETDEEEVRNVYAVLRFLVETNNSVYCGVAMGYSSSSKWQDKIKGFNERFVMVLIRHVERYLTK